ncbi:MAG: insulinase family protein [Coriobacteriales bacterium]|nr:insulinase family protein [Coriobacteriales bacterium]
MSDYTKPCLSVGTSLAGFVVTEVLPLPEISGYAHVMRHEATGARTLWVATDDENKSFAIAFKTAPANDKGVFHILEHSVLCGSDRFPVKEPFVNLLKTSMQTFLNALTFADKTMYPVASTNTADLENLMDVYLDAVLHPAIYHRPRIFEQEGWHYEIGEDGSLTYNGVVFNEMKGATSDPDDVLFLALDQALFPDTPYRFESGGDPRAIPTLSYEEFIDNHKRHYNLANSYVILYGDMDIERELNFVGERLSQAEQRDAGDPNPLPLQQPVRAGYSRKEMATAPENAAVALAFVVGTAADRERVLAADILFDAIAGSNEAPLKRAVLKAGLGDDFRSMLMDGELQPRVILQLKGAKEGVAEQLQALVENTCAKLASDGIARELLEASLAQAEFNLREQDFGSYPAGVALSMQVMSSWLYDDKRPVDYLRYEDEISHMRAGLDTGYFEKLLQELVCESKHCAMVELVPVEEGASAEEAAELAAKLSSLTPEDIEHIKDEVAALREEQEMPDAPEDLAKLPLLSVADIDEPKPEPELLHAEAPLPCLAHEMDTRRIDYVYHYFGLQHLSYEDLPYAGILCELLGKLGTKRHSAAELDTLVELNLGTLDFFCETRGKDDDLSYAAPMLIVGASALSEKVEELARIPQEVWGETCFDDTERILALLQQRRIMLEQHFVNAGHAAAITRLCTYWSAASKVAGTIGGVDYYLFLKQLLANWDEKKDELVVRLGELAQRIFVSDDVTVSFTGSPEDRKRFWEAGGTLGLCPRSSAPATLEIPELTACNEAFVIPSNVSYVGASMAPSAHDKGSFGVWNVAQRALAYDYLWNEVRVKGGAYGTGFRRTHTAIEQFWSYRDPGIDGTLARYDAAGAWLGKWNPSEEELTGYIVSTVANHDSPVKPRQMARRQDSMYFSQRPEGWRDQIRAQELGATVDAVRALAQPLEELASRRCVCVFAPRDAIEASSVKFDKVIDLMG